MSKYVILILAVFTQICFADIRVQKLLTDSSAEESGAAVTAYGSKKSFQVQAIADDAGSTTVVIESSNTPSEVDGDWMELGTVDLDISDASASAGFALDGPWKYVRARVSDITCTSPCANPVINVFMGSD